MAEQTKAVAKITEPGAIELSAKTVKAYVNQYASDQEIALFINQCAMFGLNPWKREIYLIKYSANQPANFVVGYEVYLKRAERTEKWAGMKSGTEDDPKTGKLLKAWAKVYRTDWKEPLEHEVYLEEYIQKKGDGTPTRFWAEKPRTMLKKVAISQAFRMAFPDEFSGMPYTAEEMPVDHASLPIKEIVPAPEETPAETRITSEQIEDIDGLSACIIEHGKETPATLLKRIQNYVVANFKLPEPPGDINTLTEAQAAKVIEKLKEILAKAEKDKTEK